MRQFEILRTESPALFRFNGIVYKEDFDRHYEETFIGLTDAQAERELAGVERPDTRAEYEQAAYDERQERIRRGRVERAQARADSDD